MKELLFGISLLAQSLFFPAQPTRVIDILKASHSIIQGFVCVAPTDIRCVDGVCNDPAKGFWSITVNGDYKDYNSMSLVKPEDNIKVTYQKVSEFHED